jgi:hypothetical protein
MLSAYDDDMKILLQTLEAFIVLADKVMDWKVAEIKKGLLQQFMRPVPPGDAQHGLLDMNWKTFPEGGSRNTGSYGIGGYRPGNHSSGPNHRSGPYVHSWENNGSMAYPYIVADVNGMSPTPFKKVHILGSKMILRAPVGEVVLAGPPGGMIARTNPHA